MFYAKDNSITRNEWTWAEAVGSLRVGKKTLCLNWLSPAFRVIVTTTDTCKDIRVRWSASAPVLVSGKWPWGWWLWRKWKHCRPPPPSPVHSKANDGPHLPLAPHKRPSLESSQKHTSPRTTVSLSQRFCQGCSQAWDAKSDWTGWVSASQGPVTIFHSRDFDAWQLPVVKDRTLGSI